MRYCRNSSSAASTLLAPTVLHRRPMNRSPMNPVLMTSRTPYKPVPS
jgi:hypothetical protein